MGSLQNRLVSREHLATLTEGSYEHRMQMLSTLLEQVLPERVRVLATFSDYALVLSENGSFFRVGYAYENGELEFVGSPLPIAVPVQEAKDAETQAITVDAVIDRIRVRSPWKSHYEASRKTIREFIREDLLTLEASLPKVRFRRLYDGSKSIDEAQGFAELVSSEVLDYTNRLVALAEQVKGSLSLLSASALADGSPTSLRFRVFAQDLLTDLKAVSRTMAEASTHITRVDQQARLCDALAVEFPAYTSATTFVQTVAQRVGPLEAHS